MAFKPRGSYQDSFYVLVILLLLNVPLLSSTSAQGPTILQAQSTVLQVLVPNYTTSFQEFVDCSNGPTAVRGFCIDVFKDALSILIPTPSWTKANYTCYGLSHITDAMIDELQNSSFYDMIVGDTTISAARMRKVSFTQAYLDSGIVLLIPAVGAVRGFREVFFAPFTLGAWLIVSGSILCTSFFLWRIEKFGTQRFARPFIIRFVTSALIFLKPEKPYTSPLPKFIMTAWTIFILLVGSSYTASLSSILTVNELASNIKSYEDLKNKNLPIGYSGSFLENYWNQRQSTANWVDLGKDEYANALHTRKVEAIADESPYVSLFLANQPASKCQFLVISKLTSEGFAFAFRNENLASAFSVAILNLSEIGQLQTLQNKWKLANVRCSLQIQSTQLDLESALWLFGLLGAWGVCLVLMVIIHAHNEGQVHDAICAFREGITRCYRFFDDAVGAFMMRIMFGFMRM